MQLPICLLGYGARCPISRITGSMLRRVFPIINIETTRTRTQWSKTPTAVLTDP